MCEEKLKHLLHDAEADGQKVIDDANLVDSWIVTFIIFREAIKWSKRIYAWLMRRYRGEVSNEHTDSDNR